MSPDKKRCFNNIIILYCLMILNERVIQKLLIILKLFR